MTTYAINQELNGIEITFDGKPAEAVRDELKSSGFRWHKAKKLWYAKDNANRRALAIRLAEGKTGTAGKAPKASGNKYGVKVGDFFSASWGYEQTNVDYFQVVALVGASSVRVREVAPEIISLEPTCSMAEDRVYNLDRSRLLPPCPSSVFINDQEKGDLKRLKSYAADGVSNPQFNLSSFASAYYCANETEKQYVSWYA